jgi:hypothetical protein
MARPLGGGRALHLPPLLGVLQSMTSGGSGAAALSSPQRPPTWTSGSTALPLTGRSSTRPCASAAALPAVPTSKGVPRLLCSRLMASKSALVAWARAPLQGEVAVGVYAGRRGRGAELQLFESGARAASAPCLWN